MGLYDTLIDGEKQAQVKCFDCEMNTYKVGDQVPSDGSFIIMFPPDLYAIIKDSIFLGFTDCPPVIIDKWGGHLASYDDFKNPYEELVRSLAKEYREDEG